MTDALTIASRSSRSDGVRLLQVFALAVMLIPSTTVIGAIGAPGYPGSLVGVSVFFVYAAAVLLGVYNPTSRRHPIQGVLCVLWLSALASYLLMDRATLSTAQLKGADRYLIELIVITGIALVAAEWIRTLSDARRVLRVLCWGGAFCAVVAALQYGLNLDLAQYLRELPGFTQNHDNPATVARGSLRRATGTAITPIELGVVAGMLVPLAIYLGIYDTQHSPMKRWAPTALIAVGIGTSVSRSAIIAIVVAFGVLLVLLPPVWRLAALCAVPFAVAATFMSAHGLIGTFATFFSAGSSDSSIQYRLHDYPVVEQPLEPGAVVRPRRRDIPAREPVGLLRQSVPGQSRRPRRRRTGRAARLPRDAGDDGAHGAEPHEGHRAPRPVRRARRGRLRGGRVLDHVRLARVPDVRQRLRARDRSHRRLLAARCGTGIADGRPGTAWRWALTDRSTTSTTCSAKEGRSMTLLLIGRKVWRYKLVTLPILALMFVGAVYVVAIKKPVYTTTASYILVNPPAPPTPDQIARDPKLGAGSNNPYTRFSDQSIVVQILAARIGSQQARQSLAAQGADPRYTVAPDVSFGFTAPIVQITGTGATPAEAITTANVVGRALTRLLDQMQQVHGVAPNYRITSQLLVGARQATLKASGKLRGLVAVLALGGVLLFLVHLRPGRRGRHAAARPRIVTATSRTSTVLRRRRGRRSTSCASNPQSFGRRRRAARRASCGLPRDPGRATATEGRATCSQDRRGDGAVAPDQRR